MLIFRFSSGSFSFMSAQFFHSIRHSQDNGAVELRTQTMYFMRVYKGLDTSDWLLNIVMHIKELVKTFNSSFARRDFYIEKAIVRVQNLVYMSTSAPILS